jgi:hypothetical protein
MASGFLQGEVANSWDRAQEREGASEMTWAEFRGFLLDQLIPAAQRGWNTGRQWNDLRQKNGESVREFVTRLEQLHDIISIERTEPERCEKLLYGLRLDYFDRLVQLQQAQVTDMGALVEAATVIESMDNARRYRVDSSANHRSLVRDRPSNPRGSRGRFETNPGPNNAPNRDRTTRAPTSGVNRLVADRTRAACHYCNNVGHFQKECLKKKHDEANSGPQHPKAPAQ